MAKLIACYPYIPSCEGLCTDGKKINISFSLIRPKEASFELLYKDRTIHTFSVNELGKRGSVYGISLEFDEIPSDTDWSYRIGNNGEFCCDSKAQFIKIDSDYGQIDNGDYKDCILSFPDYDWGEDKNPQTPYEDTVIYGIHVRAFTMDKSSGVTHKGTYEGVVEKIDYLKDLGVTAICLMPAYEFNEVCVDPVSDRKYTDVWGFQNAHYYAPKVKYSASSNPMNSFKNMVKEFHKNNMEVFMHMYFPEEVKGNKVCEILRHWVCNYHVDGFRISGFSIPFYELANDTILSGSKLWFDYYPEELHSGTVINSNIAATNVYFRDVARRYLKGDEGVLNDFLVLSDSSYLKRGTVNYIADYDGFSLMDVLSYDRKHNELNGENNVDGSDRNYSWNCGQEGKSRKKTVLALRKQMYKNALAFVLLSKGTPYIFEGDEFGNSRQGNNNAYCQDNDIFYINWKRNSFQNELFLFAKLLIEFRKSNSKMISNSIKDSLQEDDYVSPVSFHGSEAWKPDLGYGSRSVGILHASGPKSMLNSVYIAMNMHWDTCSLAFPKLPKGEVWQEVCESSDTIDTEIIKINSRESHCTVAPRSLTVFKAVKGLPE